MRLFGLGGGFCGGFFGRHVQHGGAHGDFDRWFTIAHAGLFFKGRKLDLYPVIGFEGLLIRQTRFGKVVRRKHEILIHLIVEIEQIGRDRIDLIMGQRLCVAKGHGAVHIVVNR